MLSKAEVLYLQGHKALSKSYERKLRCIIRKKLEILRNEFPLLSKLFANEVRTIYYGLSFGEFNPPKRCNENLVWPNQLLEVREHATKFSNFQLYPVELGGKKLVKRDGFEGSKSYDQSLIVQVATEFSNNKCNDATKNSNPEEKRRRERDLNPRGPHGPQAIQFPNFQACALPG
jgi:hypothetical protein